ncbi:MAG: phosphotransferase [Ruegeria sp.]
MTWVKALPNNFPPPSLVDELVDQGLIDANARFTSLYGGRTNQVWKVLGGECDKVLKLYRTEFHNPLFRNDPGSETACLQAFAGTGFVPRLQASGKVGPESWVFYDHAPGTPWQSNPQPVARLLRKVHALAAPLRIPVGCNGSDDLSLHGSRILDDCRSEARGILEELRPRAHVEPLAKRCLIHGDPVAGNILVTDGQITLIDWQCPVLGDPCEDIALFLSPAMQTLYRGSPLTVDEEAMFLDAYTDPDIVARFVNLRRWYSWRMAAYCLWRSENGAPDYAAGYAVELESLQNG